MTKPEFDSAVDTLLVQFSGSLTSGRRTNLRSLYIGGFANDPHTWGFGADVVWDGPVQPQMAIRANELGLHVVFERGHTHFQPLDFPAGPVTSYGGVTR